MSVRPSATAHTLRRALDLKWRMQRVPPACYGISGTLPNVEATESIPR